MELQNPLQKTLRTGDAVEAINPAMSEVDQLLKQMAGLYREQSQAIAGGHRDSIQHIAQKIGDLKARLNSL